MTHELNYIEHTGNHHGDNVKMKFGTSLVYKLPQEIPELK